MESRRRRHLRFSRTASPWNCEDVFQRTLDADQREGLAVSAANNHRSERDWLRLIVWSGTAILVLGVVVLLRIVRDQREGLGATSFSDVFFVSGLMTAWLFGLVSAFLGAGVMIARRIRWTKTRDSKGWRAMIVGSTLLVLGLTVCIVLWPGPLLARHTFDQLQLGMTKAEVERIAGDPKSVKELRLDLWDMVARESDGTDSTTVKPEEGKPHEVQVYWGMIYVIYRDGKMTSKALYFHKPWWLVTERHLPEGP